MSVRVKYPKSGSLWPPKLVDGDTGRSIGKVRSGYTGYTLEQIIEQTLRDARRAEWQARELRKELRELREGNVVEFGGMSYIYSPRRPR